MREIIRALHEFSQTILDPFDLDDLLHRVTDHATTVLDAAGAGIMLADDVGSLRFVAASQQRVVDAERHQQQLTSGTCHSAFVANELISVDDLLTDERWPDYRDRVVGLGLRSVMGVPMNAFGQTIGVINIYRDHRTTWTERDEAAGEVLAAMGAGYILNARQLRAQHTFAEHLQTAIESRDIIGQAKGILMSRSDLDSDQAFEQLRQLSRAHNRKLRDVAQELVDQRCASIGSTTP